MKSLFVFFLTISTQLSQTNVWVLFTAGIKGGGSVWSYSIWARRDIGLARRSGRAKEKEKTSKVRENQSWGKPDWWAEFWTISRGERPKQRWQRPYCPPQIDTCIRSIRPGSRWPPRQMRRSDHLMPHKSRPDALFTQPDGIIESIRSGVIQRRYLQSRFWPRKEAWDGRCLSHDGRKRSGGINRDITDVIVE